MKLHLLGICGTFMGGVAALARALGDRVSGADAGVYPPMSEQLQRLGIALTEGWRVEDIPTDVDRVVIGNALSRGNPAVEHVLDAGLDYVSGAQWLAERVLAGRTTVAVAGTHGKTTTTALLAFLLDRAGREPGFLIGGVPADFPVSARLGRIGGDPAPFVVEADEYDTAFFDKRSKFVHYRPRIAILNNLEFDHADIFDSLADIQKQFHHLVRTVPRAGRLIVNGDDPALADVLAKGCWTPVTRFGFGEGHDWRAEPISPDWQAFSVLHHGVPIGEVQWRLLGRHNAANALAALAAADALAVPAAPLLPHLSAFQGVARRMQSLGEVAGVTVYDDFAHHPTAIRETLAGLRARVGGARIVVALEPRSNSMRSGAHAAELAPALADADTVVCLHRPGLAWDAGHFLAPLGERASTVPDVDTLLADLRNRCRPGDHLVFMSNGGFEAAPRRFVAGRS